MYDPKPTAVFKKTLRAMASEQYEGEPLEGQLLVDITFYRPIQKSLSKKERLLRLLGAHRPIVKPDLDNYIKSAFDALNGVLWADDAMVVDLHAKKFYSEHPHITIEVSEIAEK